MQVVSSRTDDKDGTGVVLVGEVLAPIPAFDSRPRPVEEGFQ